MASIRPSDNPTDSAATARHSHAATPTYSTATALARHAPAAARHNEGSFWPTCLLVRFGWA
jgi:hypothetical protein